MIPNELNYCTKGTLGFPDNLMVQSSEIESFCSKYNAIIQTGEFFILDNGPVYLQPR